MPKRQRNVNNLSEALRVVRGLRELSQEDFSLVSSRTYISGLERGLKSPTLKKLEQIASVVDIQPLTLLALSYAPAPTMHGLETVLEAVRKEAEDLWSDHAKPR